MAISYVVAVRDSALDAFSRPFFVPTINAGIRSFADECNRRAEDNPLFKHPEDFELHLLSQWDEADGRFFLEEPQRMLIRAKDCVAKSNGG